MIEIKDLAGISKPATKLIEVIRDTVGVLYEPKQIRRKAHAKADASIIKARAEADASLIIANGDVEVTNIQRRGLIRVINEEGRKQENIENIIAEAIPMLDENSTPENIDPDWLFAFTDEAKNIGSEEMQSVWAKILSGEANKSGSFSKRTLALLKTMGKRDANDFTALCQFTVTVKGNMHQSFPLIYNFDDVMYKKTRMTFPVLSHLDDIGLIRFSNFGEFAIERLDENDKASYFGKEIPNAINYQAKEMPAGKAAFTSIGKELSLISGAEFQEDFYNYLCKKHS